MIDRFFNIDKKPKTLSKAEHKKLLRIQAFLANQQKNIKYLKKYNPTQLSKVKEMAAEYQQIVLTHYKLEEI